MCGRGVCGWSGGGAVVEERVVGEGVVEEGLIVWDATYL